MDEMPEEQKFLRIQLDAQRSSRSQKSNMKDIDLSEAVPVSDLSKGFQVRAEVI